MSSIASYIARRLSTSVTDRPTVSSVEQGQQDGSSPVVANGSSATGPEQRHTSHTSSEGNKDIPRRPSSNSSAISITEEEEKSAVTPSVNLPIAPAPSNSQLNNSYTPQQQTPQQKLRQQQFPNNDVLLSESIRRMAAPRDIASGLTQSFANHLSLSTSPTSTFHSPSGSYGGARPRMDNRQPSRQLKPFATGDIKILLLENVNQTARDILAKQGYQVEFHKSSLPEDQLIEKIRDVHAIGIRSKTKLTDKVLKEAKNLLVIGCFCIGTNQVDLDYAAKHGVAVFNSPFSNSRSVAELVIAEIIVLARQLGDRSMELHNGVWNKVSNKCWEIRGKTLGIVGYGHIGSQLSVLAEAMGMSVIFYDVVPLMSLGSAKQVSSLDELLSHADFVTLHVPELPETMNMIKAEQFSKMKNGSYLINASRGSVIDIPALIDAMRSGRIAGAALDVYPNEPAANGQYFTNNLNPWTEDLRSLKNLILSPHIGGSTEEAQSAIGIEVGEALVRYINEGSTIGAVNFPEVTLRSIASHQENHVRVIFIHQNRPGVLRQVNSILGDHNVDKQTSDSRGDVAYLMADVSDVGSNEIKSLYESLESLSSRIMTRLLY